MAGEDLAVMDPGGRNRESGDRGGEDEVKNRGGISRSGISR